MNKHLTLPRARQQRGAVLIVSLLLLLVMTLLGLGASQSTRLQERMAGNQRDLELALQGAESALRAAEYQLRPNMNVNERMCQTPSIDCVTFDSLLLNDSNMPLDLGKQIDQWWTDNSQIYEEAARFTTLKQAPQYVNEYYGEVKDSLTVGSSYINVVRDFYRSTGRSRGMTDSAQVVVQSTYSRVVFE
ncbi:pilus assembly PilX family protein [Peristeroidobacter soli]|jgi:type IV pilus assembly protein PilX|uniref:pilus assembly PilX family protein n=1 Tax=Peristeroidobacter soli TaxID=2497877 RepID=UPI00101C3E42|nr:PilX N-terminal domain-containing pilus assembly protein [Peristeroidobacter soli]